MADNNPLARIKLIDLFAVTLIVFSVAAAVQPVFVKSHDAAAYSCQSNLKQLGLGFIQYVQDYDEKWPGGRQHWAGTLWPYEKSTGVYHCPNDSVSYNVGDRVSYAMNRNLIANSLAALSSPSATVLSVEYDGTPALLNWDSDHQSKSTNGNGRNFAWGNAILGRADTTEPTRHDRQVMVGACDGHVKLLPPGSISSGRDNVSQNGHPTIGAAAGTNALHDVYTLTFSEI